MRVVLYVCSQKGCENAITLHSLMAFHKSEIPGYVGLEFTKVICTAHASGDQVPMRRVEVDV